MKCITYKEGYKYQLSEAYIMKTEIKPKAEMGSDLEDYIVLTSDGILLIKKGYAWDGASGPSIDTPNFMRGSLVHDALYQLMRKNKVDRDIYREPADRLLQKICKEDGMSSIRAWWVYQGVRLGGETSASEDNVRKNIKAPESCQ